MHSSLVEIYQDDVGIQASTVPPPPHVNPSAPQSRMLRLFCTSILHIEKVDSQGGAAKATRIDNTKRQGTP